MTTWAHRPLHPPTALHVRPYRGLERVQRALAGARYADVLVAEIGGALPTDRLAPAIRGWVARHAVLRTHVDDDGMTTTDHTDAAPWRIAGDGDWRQHAELALAAVFRPDLPAWRLTVVPGDGGFHLVLALHHVLCDGRSLGRLVRDLLTALDAPGGAGAGALPAEAAIVRAAPPPWTRWLAPIARHAWLWRVRRHQRATPFVGRPLAHHESPGTLLALHELPPGLPDQLRRVARRHGATLGGSLAAAAARATRLLAGRRGAGPIRVPVDAMVDLRGQLPAAPDIGMYASGLAALSGAEGDAPHWDLARRATRRTHQQQVWGVPLLAHLAFDGVDPTAWLDRRGERLALAGGTGGLVHVSNLGLWRDPVRFGGLEIRGLWSATAAVRAGPALMAWLHTVGGRGCVSATANGAVVGRAELAAWLADLADDLTLAART